MECIILNMESAHEKDTGTSESTSAKEKLFQSDHEKEMCTGTSESRLTVARLLQFGHEKVLNGNI